MPDFRTVNQGKAWSDLRGHNTSERVQDGANRPEAEIRLSNRRIEIRTGARVLRARGKWVGFKRGLTKIRSALRALSRETRTERAIRHAEYRFDRAVNRFVEDLANGRLTEFGVKYRLAKIAVKEARLENADPTASRDKILARLQTNLTESLQAVARTHPQAMASIVANFRPGGALHDLASNVQVKPDNPHAPFLGAAIQILDRVPATGIEMVRQKSAEDLNTILAKHLDDARLHDVANDFRRLPALSQHQLDYVSARVRNLQGASKTNQIPLDRDKVRTEIRLALAAVEIGLPERHADAAQMPPSRSAEPFPADLGVALGTTDKLDREAELAALSKHLAAIPGVQWPPSEGDVPGTFADSKFAKVLRDLGDADPRDRELYEKRLSDTLGEVKGAIWHNPAGPATPSLKRLQAELVIALSQVRLQGLKDDDRLDAALRADAGYQSPVYDADAARKLASKARIGANNAFPNPFHGMPASEMWKVCMDREYQTKTDPEKRMPFYESAFDRGHNAEPGYMHGMVDALTNDVCANLGKRMSAQDVEDLHDKAVGQINEERMGRGYRDGLVASYGVNKFSKDGIEQLDKRLGGYTGKILSPAERFRLMGKSHDEKFQMLKAMNRQEQSENKPAGMQTWGFMNRDGDYKAYFWPKDRAQSMQTTQKTLDAYYDEVAKATTARDKMRAIVRCCQTLHQLHVFRDGNARTMEMLLLNRLLMEQGMWPTILEDPKAFKGLTVDELVDEVEQGQLLFKIVRSGADMRPPGHIDDPASTMGGGQPDDLE
jgi:hypothetical protein